MVRFNIQKKKANKSKQKQTKDQPKKFKKFAISNLVVSRNYEDAARTLNSVANGVFYQLLLRGAASNADDLIARFLAALPALTVSDAEDPTEVNRREAAAGDSFQLRGIEARGLDASGLWGLGALQFGASVSGEVQFAISPPPQISMLFKPASGGVVSVLSIVDVVLLCFAIRFGLV